MIAHAAIAKHQLLEHLIEQIRLRKANLLQLQKTTNKVPSAPQTPCTETAPTGSSTLSFLSINSLQIQPRYRILVQ
jgi:hypothetical protein